MLFTRFTTFLSVTLLATLASAADASANNNVAVYWGQNAGGDQQRLSEYCQSNSADIVILSFLNDFPNLGLNFANACGTTFANSTLLHCPQIGQDIKYCQSQGKIVLLSLGGAYGNYGFSSDSEATSFTSVLWNKFGAGTADSQRPFDDAVVDGFDFDLEHQQQTGFVALANTLSSIYKGYAKKYYLSASPQCPYPDQSVGDVLSQSYLDFAFIQFYNNACSLDKTFNWDSWKSYATDVSPNKNIKLYLGVPGTPAIAGYVSPSVIKDELALIQGDSNFGGVSIWDASFATKNIQSDGTTFLQSIIRIVKSFVAPTSSSSAAASSTSAPASSAPTVSASDHEEDASTAVVTNLATTVITVTSCSDHKCTAVPVTTGVVVVTEVDTTYTTFCPLSTEAPGTVTETDVSTTVITVTSCSDNKCTEVPVTTGLTVVTLVDTIYTTYCPLASATASVVVPVTSATAVVVPVTSATVTVAPVTSAPVQPTVVVSTYAPVVSSTSAANVTVPAVVTFGENAAIANNAKYGFALVACGLAMLV